MHRQSLDEASMNWRHRWTVQNIERWPIGMFHYGPGIRNGRNVFS
jgi:hypothetical protein